MLFVTTLKERKAHGQGQQPSLEGMEGAGMSGGGSSPSAFHWTHSRSCPRPDARRPGILLLEALLSPHCQPKMYHKVKITKKKSLSQGPWLVSDEAGT